MVKNELIETYLNFKREILLSYALTFYKSYDNESEKIWKTEEHFKKILTGIINIYVNKYYLRSKEELNTLNKNNIPQYEFDLSLVLAMIKDYYGNEYENIKKTHELGLYNLTIIIYIITKIDKEITFYKENSVTVKNIVNTIQEMFDEIFKNLDVSKNPFLIDVLANKVKDAERKELRYFELIKGTDFYNNFSKYEQDTYYVSFTYDLAKLDSFHKEDSKRIYERYKFEEKYLPISYEQLAITILKCFVNDTVVPKFLLPVTTDFLNKKANLTVISNIFSNPYIKDKVSFSFYYNDYKNNHKKANLLKEMGFNIVLFLDETEYIIDYSYIKFDYKLYVTQKFVDNNPRFNNFVNAGNINYEIISFKDNYITEDELINSNLKGKEV